MGSPDPNPSFFTTEYFFSSLLAQQFNNSECFFFFTIFRTKASTFHITSFEGFLLIFNKADYLLFCYLFILCISANRSSPLAQLNLALAWNRIDLAKSDIFTEDRQWTVHFCYLFLILFFHSLFFFCSAAVMVFILSPVSRTLRLVTCSHCHASLTCQSFPSAFTTYSLLIYCLLFPVTFIFTQKIIKTFSAKAAVFFARLNKDAVRVMESMPSELGLSLDVVVIFRCFVHQTEQLSGPMLTALLDDKADFVELFLSNGLSMSEFLSTEILCQLYAGVRLSISFDIHLSDLSANLIGQEGSSSLLVPLETFWLGNLQPKKDE